MEISTEPGDTNKEITGKLIVKEIKKNHTIDYEAFEMLYLMIKLEDKGQKDGITFIESMCVLCAVFKIA